MKLLITLALAGSLLAQDAATTIKEIAEIAKQSTRNALDAAKDADKVAGEAIQVATVQKAQLTYQRAMNALYRAELAKAQIIDAQRNMQAAQADAARLTEEYKLAEVAALKALGKSPDLYTLNAETGQAMPKEKAAK